VQAGAILGVVVTATAAVVVVAVENKKSSDFTWRLELTQ